MSIAGGDTDGDGYSENEGDCDDTDPAINPDAQEACDGVDNNCDGQVGEGVKTLSYADSDSDDTNPDINPDATEVCDGVDNNSDGQIDEGVKTTFYADSDGYGEDCF